MSKKKKLLPEEWVCAVLIAIMLAISFFNVVARYVFNYSNTVLSVTIDCLFPWITFVGAIITCDYGLNTAFTLIVDNLPPKFRKAAELFDVIIIVAFFAVLFYYGCIKELSYIKYHTMVVSMPLIPKWVWCACVPIGSLGCIIRTIQIYVRHLKEDSKADTENGGNE